MNINSTVKQYFKDKHSASLVFLFGSHASKQANRFSDIDIGILFNTVPSHDEFNTIKEDLSALLKNDIDLVILNDASPIIKMQIIKKGVLVSQQHKNDYCNFYGDTVKQYDDLKIIRRNCEDNILKGRLYA